MNKTFYHINMREYSMEMHGKSCDECRSFCQAICCRYPWNIILSLEEYNSGRYDAIIICSLSNNECKQENDDCQYRTYQLKRKPDNSCLYLDENSFCRIYDYRPNVCRIYQCNFSFNLRPKLNQKQNISQTTSMKIESSSLINDEEIIISHPLIKIKGIILNKSLEKIFFILEIISGCNDFYSVNDIRMQIIEEEHILFLIGLFEERVPLGIVHAKFIDKYGDILSFENFHKLVQILLNHNILINVKNLRGLLSGLGL